MNTTKKKRAPKPKLVVKDLREPIIDPATGKPVMHPGMRGLIRYLARIAVDDYLAELRGEKPPFNGENEKAE